MSDRFHVHDFKTSAKLPSDPEQARLRAQLVYMASRDRDAPFDRMIDYWFAAVAWASHHDLELPPDDSAGKEFVQIGRHPQGILLEHWRLVVLNALYLFDSPGFLDGDDLADFQTSGGSYAKGGRPVGSSAVVRNANRYALAGDRPLYDALTENSDDATRIARQLVAASNLKEVHNAAAEEFASAFTDPAASA